MKYNAPVLISLMVIALAILAGTYRVSSAPERIRKRLETAQATCQTNGGQWVGSGRDQSCQIPAVPGKP